MIKNVDCAIIINRETDLRSDSDREYLGFKLEKFRGKPNDDRLYLFLHPFDEENGILLTPDIDESKPISKLRIEDFNPLGNSEIVGNGKPVFDDYDEVSNKFLENLKDIVEDDYSDVVKNYVDVYKNAEDVSKRMKRLNQMEKDLRERHKRELKNCNLEKDSKGRIIIKARNKNNENDIKQNGMYIIRKQTKSQ